MTAVDEKRTQVMTHAFITNQKVCNAMMKVKTDKTTAALNRIERYMTAPTFSDVELGLEEIKQIAKSELLKSVRRINFICGEIRRSERFELIKPFRNADGSYKKPEEMSNAELLEIFEEYKRLDWLIKSARDEFAMNE